MSLMLAVTTTAEESGPGSVSRTSLACVASGLPAGEVFQLEDVHRLGVARSTEELRVHAENQGADGHVPGTQSSR